MEKIKLLGNLPIYADKIPIYSPTLKSIAQLGKEQYSVCLSFCMVTKETVLEKNNEDKDDFDALIRLCLKHDFLYSFIYSLSYFTKLEFKPALNELQDFVFRYEDIELNRLNYKSFIKCIKFANCIEVHDVEEMDEFDRRCAEMEKKIREKQNNNASNPELEDLISAVANMDGNGLNIINIWDLNIYQFYEQLQRGQLKEQYRLAIKQLLAGAKSEDVTVESYFKTIK